MNTQHALGTADIVILPTWHEYCRAAPAKLLEALRRAHKRGARIVGLCLGAFPLAEAGLLDGSDVSIEVVAQQAGFGSALSLRQHFRAALHTSPSAYRSLFRTSAAS